MIEISMVGFQKLHSPIWNCNMCEKLVPFPSVDDMLEHLKEVHKIQDIKIGSDGGAWISEITN